MRVFDRIASRYDLGMLPLEWLVLRRLRRSLHPLPGLRVLELGVGTGVNLEHHRSCAHVVGVDLSQEMLSVASQRSPSAKIDLLCADVERLPFADGAFDTVLTSLLFCSVAAPKRGMAEIVRVLRPEGRLIMLEHVRGNHWLTRFLTDRLDGWWHGISESCHLNRETEALVAASGLCVVKTSRYIGGIFQVIEARNNAQEPLG